MFFDSSCNPDEVVQSHSPLLKAIHPRLEPASAPTSSVQFDENVDDYHLDTPWDPALRVSGRATPLKSWRPQEVLPTPLDAILLDHMSGGRLPHVGAIAQEETLSEEFDAMSPGLTTSLASPGQLYRDTPSPVTSPEDAYEDDPRDVEFSPRSDFDTSALPPMGAASPDSISNDDPPSPTAVMQAIQQAKPARQRCDSGTDDNAIVFWELRRLGLSMSAEADDVKEFYLANGTTIKSQGKMACLCNFAQGYASSDRFVTFFYVFETLVEPIIVGLKFLGLTETLSKHRDRLVELNVPQVLPLRVLSIGMPRRNLLCRLAEDPVFATADSGSDLDFVSGKYAASRNLLILPNKERIMLADGSMITTSGVVRLPLSIGDMDADDVKEQPRKTRTISGEFHIFDGMVHDVLIGHTTIEKLHIFTQFSSSLLPGFGLLNLSSLNIIRHLRKTPTLKGIKEFIQRGRSSQPQATTSSPIDVQEEEWENARRSAEAERIEALRDPTKALRARAEEDQRQVDSMKSRTLDPEFLFRYSGCNGVPLKSQSLLNVIANIRSSEGPHFCPVKGCPRSEGGKGFKHKRDLIRHEIIHESPGHLCPFCTEREHKYPRPDNLQRHVRVHHPDKDKDDPQLREVLAQRPGGPNRGRRRRIIP